MIAGCPHYRMDGRCDRLKNDCRPVSKGCVLYGKARLPVLNGGDDKMVPQIETLDLRAMPLVEWYEKILQIWNNLKPGEMLKVINNHDPRPLRYHFAAEQAGNFKWEYEQEGPVDLIVKIKRAR